MLKISTKLDRCHPLRGRQIQVGWVKIGDFRQIAGYISKTVQDRRMVSIKVEYGPISSAAAASLELHDDTKHDIMQLGLPKRR